MMKATTFFKSVCVVMAMVASVSVANAQGNYVTNDIMDGDRVVTRFVYEKNSELHPHLKSDFTYDDQNRISTKESFLWNKKKQEWVPQKRIHYTYTDSQIIITGDTWKKDRRAYAKNDQRSVYNINKAHLDVAQLTSHNK